MHLQLLATTSALSVFHDVKNDWLYLDWQGDLTRKSVQEGCIAVARCFLRKNYVRVLNDNTSVTSLSPEVASWLATECLPRIKLSTIEYLAWTYSPNIETQFWTNVAMYQIDGPVVVTFDDVESAYAWLREVKFRSPGSLSASALSGVAV
ncbi:MULTISPECIES: hypothetical protein [Hymenobacter]|uniref:STAS/SEC14 domain-containing protein n=2 Tax=Hymenobacter TaxID=89966 RepID=A0ABS6WXW6_9BACT|nr:MULTISPECIES: hypothetical protein [Hymenobacter]MBO3269270.1 hypothetical protein [Hymenobacter defluvii]MBW3128361.1 hypothetical protein [Hymenobacter profundi]QNE38913.1 hypothetical protein F1C16_04740 [Hymenobacter sp. NBH84]